MTSKDDDFTMKANVHKVTLLIVDCEQYSAEEIKQSIENKLEEQVIDIQTTSIDWHDDHPLNQSNTQKAEMDRLFKQ